MAKRYKICIMTEGCGPLKIRSFSASVWWLRIFFWPALLALVVLSTYAVYSYRTLSTVKDQGLEVEVLKSQAVGKERQIAAISERLVDLDRKLAKLSHREKELSLLTRDFNRQLGLSEAADLEETWPALIQTVAWTWGGNEGRGGLDKGFAESSFSNPAEILKGLHRDLDRLELNASTADLAVSELTSALSGSRKLLAVTPYAVPLPNSKLTSAFGYRTSPFGGNRVDLHRGMDLAAPTGTKIYSPAKGTVLSSDWSNNGYGLMVTLDHGFGLTTRYAHLSESLVEAGQEVERGQVLAKVGSTGRSTGPHLHYETVLGGVPVDPNIFLRMDIPVELQAAAKGQDFKSPDSEDSQAQSQAILPSPSQPKEQASEGQSRAGEARPSLRPQEARILDDKAGAGKKEQVRQKARSLMGKKADRNQDRKADS
jgi:biotin carboxyl carrier protein